MIPINIVCEDLLSEAVAKKILQESNKFFVGATYRKNGKSFLRNKFLGFNESAKGMPYFIVVDLDDDECAPSLINSWLGRHVLNPKLIFRVAVKEIETWILADRENFASFAGINKNFIPIDVEGIVNPKEFLIELTSRSNKRVIRESILPKESSTAKVGPYYNGKLIEFVNSYWSISDASNLSNSLNKTIDAISTFKLSV